MNMVTLCCVYVQYPTGLRGRFVQYSGQTFLAFSLFQCQGQQLDSNPQPWDYEADVLPLRYHHWQTYGAKQCDKNDNNDL
jgi:hypothetical protein